MSDSDEEILRRLLAEMDREDRWLREITEYAASSRIAWEEVVTAICRVTNPPTVAPAPEMTFIDEYTACLYVVAWSRHKVLATYFKAAADAMETRPPEDAIRTLIRAKIAVLGDAKMDSSLLWQAMEPFIW